MQKRGMTLNYFRICFIAFNLVPEGPRQVFKQEWNFPVQSNAWRIERHAKEWLRLLPERVSRKPLEELAISVAITEW